MARDSTGDVTSDQTQAFGHDGHGSVRVLSGLMAAVAPVVQVMTYSAYGELLSLHDSAGLPQATTSRLSSLGYSGEHFDTSAQQQYLRARFYSPTTGRFNRLDPFIGNNQDPQSLHKYAYTHGDPVGAIDPSGSIAIATSIAIGGAFSAAAGAGVAYSAGGGVAEIALYASIGGAAGTLALFAPWLAFGLSAGIIADLLISSKITDRSIGAAEIPSHKVREAIIYGELAALAYETDPNLSLPPGWQRLNVHTHSIATNYRAQEFYHAGTNEVVLAFAGTDDIPADLVTDIFQGTVGSGTDYNLAISDALAVSSRMMSEYPAGATVRFVGHSLGGGLAAAATAVVGGRASTFNAAGVARSTVTRFGGTLSSLDSKIDAFRVKGEFLSTWQDSISITGAVMPDGNGTTYWVPGSGNLFIRHTMGPFLETLRSILRSEAEQ